MPEQEYTPYRWFVLVALACASAATVSIILSPVTMVGAISKTTGLSMGAATFAAMGTIDLSTALSGLAGGFAAARFGVWRVWIVGLLTLIAGSLLLPTLGNGFWGIAVIRFIHGCGAGPIIATTPMIAAEWFPPSNRGTVIGVQGTMVSVGAILSLTFVPFIFGQTAHWHTAVASAAIFPAFTLALVLMLTRGPAALKAAPSQKPKAGGLLDSELRRVLMWPGTWALVLCSFSFSWEIRTFNDLIPSYLAVSRPMGVGLGPQRSGDIMAFVQIAFGLGPLAGGFLTDRIFKGRVLPVIVIGCALSAAAIYALHIRSVTDQVTTLTIALLASGIGMSVTLPQVMTFVSKEFPERMVGKLGGILMGCGILGGVTGVSICSYVLHVTGAYQLVVILVALAPASGGATAVLLLRRPPQLLTIDSCGSDPTPIGSVAD